MKRNKSRENYERFHIELITLTEDIMNMVNKYSLYFIKQHQKHSKKLNRDLEKQIVKFNKSYDNQFNTTLCSHLHIEDYEDDPSKYYTKEEMLKDGHEILNLQQRLGELLFDSNSPLNKTETVGDLFDEFTTFKFDYEDLFLNWFPESDLLWGSGGLIGVV